MMDLKQAEIRRVHSAITVALMACLMMVIAIAMMVAALVAIRGSRSTPSQQSSPRMWLDSMTGIANALLDQATPVSTALTLATIAAALAVACAFGGRAEREMRPLESAHVDLLKSITEAFCLASGNFLIVASAILLFAGPEGAIGSITALGIGVFIFYLGMVVPVRGDYWEKAIGEERQNLAALTELRRTMPTPARSTRALWPLHLTQTALLRVVWTLSCLGLLYILSPDIPRGSLILALILATMIVVGGAWDASLTWSWLVIRTWWVVDRLLAVLMTVTWSCSFLLLLLSLAQMSFRVHWLVGLFATGLFAPPFIIALIPLLNRRLLDLLTKRFDTAISRAESDLDRYDKYLQLTSAGPQSPTPSRADVAQQHHHCCLMQHTEAPNRTDESTCSLCQACPYLNTPTPFSWRALLSQLRAKRRRLGRTRPVRGRQPLR